MQLVFLYYFLATYFNVSTSFFHIPSSIIFSKSYLRGYKTRHDRLIMNQFDSESDIDSEFDYDNYHDYDNYDEHITFVEYYKLNTMNHSNEYEYYLAMNKNLSMS